MKTQILKTKLKPIVIIVLLLTIFCSCSLDLSNPTPIQVENELPPITQTGENTFGCYIDGELLIPRDGSSGSLDGITYSYLGLRVSLNEYNYFSIRAANAADDGGDYIYII